jgi:hypothetical protein
MEEGQVRVGNQGSRMRGKDRGIAQPAGKASEGANTREKEEQREDGRQREREGTMNGGVICNGISWQQWRIVWRDGRIAVC